MTKCWYLVIFSFSFGVVAFQELADESSLNKVSFFISYDYASSCQLVCRTYSTVTILKSIDALYHGTFDAIELYMYYFFKTGTKKLWLWSYWSFKFYHYRFVMNWTIPQSPVSRVGRESEGHGNVWCLSQLEGCIEYALYNYALLLGPFLHTMMIINYCLRKSLILRKRTCWEIWSDIEREMFLFEILKTFQVLLKIIYSVQTRRVWMIHVWQIHVHTHFMRGSRKFLPKEGGGVSDGYLVIWGGGKKGFREFFP